MLSLIYPNNLCYCVLHFLTDVFFTVSDSGAHMVWQHLRDESGNKMNAATKVCTYFALLCIVCNDDSLFYSIFMNFN